MTGRELCARLGISPKIPVEWTFSAVTRDSRKVVPGALFVAERGSKADGHDFAEQAAAAGAVAIIGEREGLTALAGLPYLRVPDARIACGIAAHALAGDPTRALTVLGITGTNGKTSTAHMVEAILNQVGRPCANFGTITFRVGGEELPAPHTTPFAEDLVDLFLRAMHAGQRHVVMEVSSHALDQERVAGVLFDAAAFTNLTRDHLDYHPDMEAYFQAKRKLFERVGRFQSPKENGVSPYTVVNREDPAWERFRDASPVPCITCGIDGDVRAEQIQMDLRGSRFRLITPRGTADVAMRLTGRHNIQNALCAAGLCYGLGLSPDEIATGLSAMRRVPGRFELVDRGQPFSVIVDYAHTDDGLRNVLEAVRPLCKERVIVVFGCGGDRDRGKRPKMGAVAAKLADLIILTSDNPRTEDPLRILMDIEVGVQQRGKRKYEDYEVIEDREAAIRKALQTARPGDAVVIAGKGHEPYQIIGTKRYPFDDREVAARLLEELRP